MGCGSCPRRQLTRAAAFLISASACITALVSRDLPVAEYTALQMKSAVVGYGRAQKSQVQEMVRRLLELPGLPGTDAADALGMAITHAHAGKIHQLRALAAAAYPGKD